MITHNNIIIKLFLEKLSQIVSFFVGTSLKSDLRIQSQQNKKNLFSSLCMPILHLSWIVNGYSIHFSIGK